MLDTLPRVSVIIAVMNGKATLSKCLDSVFAQDYSNIEVIVIDGQSTDGTIDIIKSFGNRINYWTSERDTGIYNAWNKGVKASSGQWLVFIGCDDMFSHSKSLSLLVAATQESLDFVFAKVALMDESGQVIGTKGQAWNWSKMKRYQVVAHSGALHSRRLFDEFGCFDERYKIAGDYEFLLRVGKYARTAFVDEAVVNFGMAGVSSSQVVKTLLETKRAQQEHRNLYGWQIQLAHASALVKAKLKGQI